MSYCVEITKTFTAKQGLKSPVLAAKGLAPSAPAEGFEVVLRVGIVFEDDQLTDRGWFVDTDAAEDVIAEVCDPLSHRIWTDMFDFRPTFEHVARWTFQQLAPHLKQLQYVELENATLGVTTRYSAQPAA